jgi:ATP-binding cassette subfamily B (MDR/TAP) protein 1
MAGLRITAALRLAYIRAVFAQPISKLDEISSGTVATTITSLSNEIQSSITDRSAQLFQSLALLIGAYVVAFRFSWALTLVSSSCLLFMLLIYSFTTPLLVKLQRKVDKADQKVVSIATSTVRAIRTVFSLGAEPSLTRKHGAWAEETKRRGLQLSLITGIQFGPFFFATYANYSLTFWFGIKLFADGDIGSINSVVM